MKRLLRNLASAPGFFAVVVEEIEAHGGLVNKFEGDAALAIFGAPVDSDDPAGSALGAARAMADRLRREVPEVDCGIGVSAGRALGDQHLGACRPAAYQRCRDYPDRLP
jgi:class 3 adenylate cyclase